MSIEATVRFAVIDPLSCDRTIIATMKSKGSDFDDYLRTTLLDRGKAAIKTLHMALSYAYTHMLQHYDALWSIFQSEAEQFDEIVFDHGSHLGIVDFGCDPLTAPLAIADELALRNGQRLRARVFGIDKSKAMRYLAACFAGCKHFDGDSKFYWSKTWNSEALERASLALEDVESIVFVFSYFFGQENIGKVENIARFCQDLLLRVRPAKAKVLYLNSSLAAHGAKFAEFAEFMKVRPMLKRMNYEFRYYRRLSEFPEPDRLATEGEPLIYCMQGLDWRDYVGTEPA